MPTISDLKDQARALEQQGKIEKALTIYQHILKHLEGNPAITKVLPLYVKAGDLLQKLDRPDEAIESYQSAAEHYASTGAATRVTSLCEKILRLAPERKDVYTTFVKLLMQNGHIGSARDVFAEYARTANMRRALETLDDLAGRPNSEVQPMLERLLESFEMDGLSDQSAERVSVQLDQDTDDLAGELSGVPDEGISTEEPAAEETPAEEEPEEDWQEEEAVAREEEDPSDEPQHRIRTESAADNAVDPLTPHLLDLDSMPRQSSIQRAITDEDLDEEKDTSPDEDTSPEEDTRLDEDTPQIEHSPEAEITTNLNPTMDSIPVVSEDSFEQHDELEKAEDDTAVEEAKVQEPAAEEQLEGEIAGERPERDDPEGDDGGTDLLLAESISADDSEDVDDSGEQVEADDGIEIEGSEWKDDFPEPSAEETLTAKWAPEEELRPAVRYPSDGYEKPDEVTDEPESAVEPTEAESDHLDEEVAKAVEGAEEFSPAAKEPEVPVEPVDTQPEHESPKEPIGRPTGPARPPRVTLPQAADTKSKSPLLFGIGGFVVGALAGAGLTFVLVGGGGDVASPTVPVEPASAAVDSTASQAEPPTSPETGPTETSQTAPPAAETQPPSADTSTTQEATETADADTILQAAIEPTQEEETTSDTTPATSETEQLEPTETTTGNPIVLDGIPIEEFSEVESGDRSGFRVVHLLDWAEPLVIEAYRDTTVTMSTYIQVEVTPPDTVVGIRRMDGYMVYASGVMPEDSLRSLMSRLVVGERPRDQ